MAPTLSALLCLGLCLSWRIWAQKHTLPRPTLRAEPGLVIPHGQPVSLWYKGPPGAVWYDLLKEDYYHMRRSAAGREAEFPISPVTAYTAGSYQCFYQIQSSRSEASKPLVQTVTGLYYSPSVSALPSSEVASGHNVTLLCHSEVLCDTYILYNDGDRNTQDPASQDYTVGNLLRLSLAGLLLFLLWVLLAEAWQSDRSLSRSLSRSRKP
ncbi:natural cytotoxicity triggering receptor 1-like isoform X2 [Notamacropus eugenii]|uniref:natural cytotoxicity triggering receptor 1-like isoform X2 n=1 Tax=Notamacropus eugenii TaxID=9315 RepID=UPI003B6844EF